MPTAGRGLLSPFAGLRSVRTAHPPPVGAFLDTPTFLNAAAAAGEDVGRYLDIWNDTPGAAVVRHLADAVNRVNFASRKSGTFNT